MAAGKPEELNESPILKALQAAKSLTQTEIQVHLSKRWIEKDPYQRAERIFQRVSVEFPDRLSNGSILLYINLRRRKFAILGDVISQKLLGSAYWEKIEEELKIQLRSTHYERAIAQSILSLAKTLTTKSLDR